MDHNQNLALIHPYPTCRHISCSNTTRIWPLSHPQTYSCWITTRIFLSHLQTYLHWITTRISPWLPLSHLQTYSCSNTIRILPLFALIPCLDIFALKHNRIWHLFALILPADIFMLNNNQNFALICLHPTCRHICTQTQPEFGTYLPALYNNILLDVDHQCTVIFLKSPT